MDEKEFDDGKFVEENQPQEPSTRKQIHQIKTHNSSTKKVIPTKPVGLWYAS